MKVLTYNIFHVGWRERLPLIADVIRTQAADAVALMEATNKDEVESLAKMLDMDFVYGQGNHQWSVVWLSRLPIRRAVNHQLPPLFHTLLEVEVLDDGIPHRLFATHLCSVGPDHRFAGAARRRTNEAQAVLDTLLPLAAEPHLLVGDFNATRPRERLALRQRMTNAALFRRYHRVRYARTPIQLTLDRGYVDCYRTMNPRSPGYTILSQDPCARIDFVFASPVLAPRLVGCDVVTSPGTQRASDHFPVWAEFA